jgi:hypothetical protein
MASTAAVKSLCEMEIWVVSLTRDERRERHGKRLSAVISVLFGSNESDRIYGKSVRMMIKRKKWRFGSG